MPSASPPSSLWSFSPTCRWVLGNGLGVLLCLLAGGIYARFFHDLHENTLFFSSIQEVERRISMRTESGFYASFYFQVVEARTLKGAVRKLLSDRKSEFPHTINALERFNIFPELCLGVVYRLLGPVLPPPTFFYAYSCFFMAGFAVCGVFVLAWAVGHEWIFGLMAATWMLVNYEDTSRVNFALNMRETFALPWLWLQLAVVVRVLQKETLSALHFFLITAFTFLFAICWQFAQYVLLFESASLFAVSLLLPEQTGAVRRILFTQTVGFSFGIVAQFFQPMLLVSSVLCFNLSFFLLSAFLSTPQVFSFKSALVRVLSTFVFFVSLVFASKFVVTADSHIWSFFLAKFGLSPTSPPFETLVYLCHAAFGFLDHWFVERTMKNGILQVYVASVGLFLFVSAFRFFKSRQMPSADRLFLNVQSLLFAGMAYTTLRMKYILVPHMAVLGAATFGSFDRFVGRYVKYAVILALIAKMSTDHYDFYLKVMSHEQEFYDPDTVKLMEFIEKEGDRSVYTGSMQLLAGVKCCTNRRITNHPHFEDKRLRDRTFRLYQIYGRQPVEDVVRTLKTEKATHVIVENSICYARSDGCALKDVVDVANGVRTESDRLPPGVRPAHLQPADRPRFCEAVEKAEDAAVARSLRLVFQNRTFRVYRLL